MNRMVKKAFRQWDTDGNGSISFDEMTKVLVELCAFKKHEAHALMKEADRNGNGVIEYNEFADWIVGGSAPLGASALLNEATLNIRADVPEPIGPPVGRTGSKASRTGSKGRPSLKGGDVLAWQLGPGQTAVPVEPAMVLEAEHTVTCWIRLDQSDSSTWTQKLIPLYGDKPQLNWGFSVGVTPGGGFAVSDARLGDGDAAVKETGQGSLMREGGKKALDQWIFVAARASCNTPSSSEKGETEFSICTDVNGVRSVGSVPAVGSGLILAEFGSSKSKGVASMTALTVWPRELEDMELRNVFLHDAVRLDVITQETAAWMRLNRRIVPERTAEQAQLLATRCENAEAGDDETGGLLDLSSLAIVDSDLPDILSVVDLTGSAGITTLRLNDNYITEDGVSAHLGAFLKAREAPFFLDISDNLDIAPGAGEVLAKNLQADLGCRVGARGTQILGEVLHTLENYSEKAAAAVRLAADQKESDAYERGSDGMDDKIKASVDPPWDEKDSGDFETANKVGLTEEGGLEEPKKPLYKKFPGKAEDKLKIIRGALAMAGRRYVDREDGQAFGWSASSKDKRPMKNCGGGQMLAHFSYLSFQMRLRGPEDFGLRLRAKGESYEGKGKAADAFGLHKSLEDGSVEVESAVGNSFGKKSLTLKLKNLTDDVIRVVVSAGTIFCQGSWIHHQNLLVFRNALFTLPPKSSKQQQIDAHCMNLSCGCPKKDPMQLTPFVLDKPELLSRQAAVWEYFEGLFQKYKEEAGFKPKGKKGK